MKDRLQIIKSNPATLDCGCTVTEPQKAYQCECVYAFKRDRYCPKTMCPDCNVRVPASDKAYGDTHWCSPACVEGDFL